MFRRTCKPKRGNLQLAWATTCKVLGSQIVRSNFSMDKILMEKRFVGKRLRWKKITLEIFFLVGTAVQLLF